ncbi:hypothetical protein ACFLU6_04810 [Acidobacteriota bacterium]
MGAKNSDSQGHLDQPEELRRQCTELEKRLDRAVAAQQDAENALRESEEKFRSLAEHSPAMIWINQGER